MKLLGKYTVRGRIDSETIVSRTTPHYIQLFDGLFTTGYKVTKFIVAPYDVDLTNIIVYSGKLMTIETGNATFWDWADNREIAWSTFGFDANGIVSQFSGEIDSDNMIIEDLYLFAENNGDLPMNYLIEFEKYDISEGRGAMTQVRNK